MHHCLRHIPLSLTHPAIATTSRHRLATSRHRHHIPPSPHLTAPSPRRENGNLKDIDTGAFDPGQGPAAEYEALRRKVHSDAKELWYYASYHFRRAMREEDKLAAMQRMLNDIEDRKR